MTLSVRKPGSTDEQARGALQQQTRGDEQHQRAATSTLTSALPEPHRVRGVRCLTDRTQQRRGRGRADVRRIAIRASTAPIVNTSTASAATGSHPNAVAVRGRFSSRCSTMARCNAEPQRNREGAAARGEQEVLDHQLAPTAGVPSRRAPCERRARRRASTARTVSRLATFSAGDQQHRGDGGAQDDDQSRRVAIELFLEAERARPPCRRWCPDTASRDRARRPFICS